MDPATRFDQWKRNETFERMNAALNQIDRHRVGKESLPSAVCIDSQSVKIAPLIREERGLDAHKRVNGRKRQLIVDTQGRLWVADITGVDEKEERKIAHLVLTKTSPGVSS